jgi:phage repressor protein C with HTH and peptisase S24 domain
MGLAIRRARKAADMTQAEAALRAGTFQQTWQRYESGTTDAHLKLPRLRELAQAIGTTAEDLMVAADRIQDTAPVPRAVVSELAERGRPYDIGVFGRAQAGALGQQVVATDEPERTIDIRQIFGRKPRFTTIAGESMIPWGLPGQMIAYDEDNPFPRREQGCVIITSSGEVLVKLFKRMGNGKLEVEELNPIRRTIEFDLSDIQNVWGVTGKLE